MPDTYIFQKQSHNQNTWEIRIKNFLLGIVVGLFITGIIFWFSTNTFTFYAQSTAYTPHSHIVTPIIIKPTIMVTATPTPTIEAFITPTIDPVKIKNDIQVIINQHPELNLGVSFISIKDGTRADVNGSEVFTAGSTTKVFIACLLLSQVEAGKYTLTQPLQDATIGQDLKKMINQSDNDSWMSLMSFIGYQYQIPFATKLGITSYNVNDNKITPNDMALLLDELYTNRILNTDDTKLLLSYMQHTVNEDLIPPVVPSGAEVYHKYGSYNGDLHDAAIIDNGTNPFVLTIYTVPTTDPVSYQERLPVFHDIGIAVENDIGIITTGLPPVITPVTNIIP